VNYTYVLLSEREGQFYRLNQRSARAARPARGRSCSFHRRLSFVL